MMEIVVVKGNIADQVVDAIVNTTTCSLDDSAGPVTQAVFELGGEDLKAECEQEFPDGIEHGDVAVTSVVGNLQCEYVFHTSLPSWTSDTEEALQNIIENCLQEAEDRQCSSLAFPALGTGTLKYPPDIVAKIFLETVISFAQDSPDLECLERVFIVLHPNNEQVVQAFDKEMDNHINISGVDIFNKLDQAVALAPAPVSPLTSRRAPAGCGVAAIGTSVKVSFVIGDISQQKVDVIINSTTSSLNLSSGPLTKAILAAGGDSLQQECNDNYPTGIKTGEIAVTSGGNMPCKHVYHTHLPNWSTDPKLNVEKTFRGFIQRCLEKAEGDGLKSIAFPSLGGGTLKYPPDTIARCMFETAHNFQGVNLKKVTFIVHSTDKLIIQAFKTEAARHSPAAQLSGRWSGFQITLAKGDIAQQSVDILVNSTVPRLNLSSGPVTQAILKAGGDVLQQECTDNYPQGIKTGEIAVTGGGNLPCKKVYHTTLKEWSADLQTEQDFRSLIVFCLTKASRSNMKSIAFPVLGTGVLKYPRDIVARCVFETFDSFRMNNPNSSLQEVRIVVHPEDVENVKAFEDFKRGANSDNEHLSAVGQPDLEQEPGFEAPPHWLQMHSNDFVRLIQLCQQDAEYQTVAASFAVSMGLHTVIKIERIQNRTLYHQYRAMKHRFYHQNEGIQNERKLWHGTAYGAIASINVYGFNRSFCGKNATMYGEGVYFAQKSSYSAQDTYAVTDGNGYKHMYQASVLTGTFTVGTVGIKVPPLKDANNSHLRYDSVANCTSNPEIFVIFHDTQAYPEYLITFKT